MPTLPAHSPPQTGTPRSPQGRRTGGRVLVDALRIHGVDRIYCVPGESYLPVLDALHDTPEIQTIVCRHEGAAANMADADGKLTGRPGICFVTRGPGATQASVGIHTAFQDSTPLILFIGQVDRPSRDREAFQELDYRQTFAGMAKWVAEIERADRVPEYVARAFRTATSGRSGPVVLSLPEDMLQDECEVADTAPYVASRAHPSPADIDKLERLLSAAERPLVIVGGSGWTEQACTDIAAFIESHALPVAASFRCQHLFDNTRPNYIGHLALGVSKALAARVKSSDLLIVIGARLGEATTSGYTLVDAPTPRQSLIHVHAGAEELGRVYQPVLAINSGMPEIAAALRGLPSTTNAKWRRWTEDARAEHEAFVSIARDSRRRFGTSDVMLEVERQLPPEAIVANGAGNFSIWVHRYHQYRRFRGQLAPTSGAMGYGLPAAIAAKLRYPDRLVVCFAGDGDFMVYPQELITAVRYRAPIVVIVINNNMYGSIRMHQERHYPGRVFGSDLLNPDFARLADAFGATGTRVESGPDFARALAEALSSGRPAVIEVNVDPAQITPDVRISD